MDQATRALKAFGRHVLANAFAYSAILFCIAVFSICLTIFYTHQGSSYDTPGPGKVPITIVQSRDNPYQKVIYLPTRQTSGIPSYIEALSGWEAIVDVDQLAAIDVRYSLIQEEVCEIITRGVLIAESGRAKGIPSTTTVDMLSRGIPNNYMALAALNAVPEIYANTKPQKETLLTVWSDCMRDYSAKMVFD